MTGVDLFRGVQFPGTNGRDLAKKSELITYSQSPESFRRAVINELEALLKRR
nr:hypothetical protein Hi04_10k_c5016_00030 [uncultured bacterium]